MDKHTITLDFPKEHNGQSITELCFRRPEGGDIRRSNKAKGDDLDRSFALMANLAEVEIEVIDRLDPVDIDKINDWLEPILDPKGRRVGSGN